MTRRFLRPERHARIRQRAAHAWREDWREHGIAATGLLIVWLVLWGELSVPLVLSGVALSIIVLVLFPLPPIKTALRIRFWPTLILGFRFAVDVVMASLQVSYMALRPRPPVSDVVIVQLVTDSDLIQHLTALAVSLVPGSLIIDADPADRTLTIHVIYLTTRPPDRFIGEVLAQEARFRAAFGDRSTYAARIEAAGLETTP